MTSRTGLPEPGGVFIGHDFYRHGLVSLSRSARITHAHVVGASNRGKSNLLEVLIRQDILRTDGAPRGVTVIDPHGSTVDSTVEWIAQHRLYKHRTVRVIDPSDGRFAFSFNPFRALSHFDLALSVCDVPLVSDTFFVRAVLLVDALPCDQLRPVAWVWLAVALSCTSQTRSWPTTWGLKRRRFER